MEFYVHANDVHSNVSVHLFSFFYLKKVFNVEIYTECITKILNYTKSIHKMAGILTD